MKKTLVYSLSEIDKVVSLLKEIVATNNIVAISGSLGAGKTTLITRLLKSLGVQGPITSPTFSYVNTYRTEDGKTIHHFDLYRVGSAQEFIDSGFDEYLHEQDALVLIEWPEVIKPLLPKETVQIELDYETIGQRKMVLYN